jgi:hypothetical protein
MPDVYSGKLLRQNKYSKTAVWYICTKLKVLCIDIMVINNFVNIPESYQSITKLLNTILTSPTGQPWGTCFKICVSFGNTVVVETLHNKPEESRFDSRCSHWCRFSICLSFEPHHGRWVDSATNTNEYHKIFLGNKARPAYSTSTQHSCHVITACHTAALMEHRQNTHAEHCNSLSWITTFCHSSMYSICSQNCAYHWFVK